MALNPQNHPGMYQPGMVPQDNTMVVAMVDYGVKVEATLINVKGVDRLIAMLENSKKFFAQAGNAIGT